MSCSLLLYTFNRPEYLKRYLLYLKKINFNFDIYILDSSNKENFYLNKKNIEYINLNINHLKFSQDINPSEKIYISLKNVSSKYVLISPDDDFISFNGIKKCIEFLENNQEYSLAHGNYYNYYTPGNKLTFQAKFSWKKRYNSKLINDNSVYKRFLNFFNNYDTPLLYSLYRTDFLLITFKHISKCITFQNGEWMQAMIAVILSKIGYVDTFFLIKEKPSIKGYQYTQETKGYKINKENLTLDKNYIINSLTDILAKNNIQNSKRIIEIINRFYDDRLSFYDRKTIKTNSIDIFYKKIIKFLLPNEIIKLYIQYKSKIKTSFRSFNDNEKQELEIIKKLF